MLLIALSCFVQSGQFVLEEKYISSAAKPPPLFVVGVEGVWGMLISLLVIYPAASFIPGDDNGCYETLTGATDILFSSKNIMVVTAIYFTCVFTFNAIGIFITKILDALWKALVSVRVKSRQIHPGSTSARLPTALTLHFAVSNMFCIL